MKNNRVLAVTALTPVFLFSASTAAIAQASDAEPPAGAPAEDEAKDPGELIVVTGSP
jgi:hypothetical protein